MPSNQQEPRSRHQAGGDNGIPIHGKPKNIRPLPSNQQEPVKRYYPDLVFVPSDAEAASVTVSMKPYQDGPWVAFTDYDTLKIANKRLREMLNGDTRKEATDANS